MDDVERRDLEQTAKEASDAVHRTFTDAEIYEILSVMLNLREIRWLDKAMQTIRGELTKT